MIRYMLVFAVLLGIVLAFILSGLEDVGAAIIIAAIASTLLWALYFATGERRDS